jgi:hypothetical protein
MSNFAKPDKQLWYLINRPELAEPIQPQARNKFHYGHILEEWGLFLAEVAGHKVEAQQEEVSYHGVLGHIDAIIDGVVVDVKSANSRSFSKFREHRLDSDDPFGYRDQLSLYVLALQGDARVKIKGSGAFLAIDKELGHIVLDSYKNKETDYEAEIIRKRKMLELPEPPDRCFEPIPDGKSGNLRLNTQCSYCPFKEHCWPESRTFLYSNGPRTLVHVEREPDVPEIKRGEKNEIED